METFAVRDLREHTGDLVRNAENGEYSIVSKHGKPLFVAMPFTDALLAAGVNVALADKMVLQGALSVAAGAKLASMPYARYLQHLSALGYSMLDDAADMEAELTNLQNHLPTKSGKASRAATMLPAKLPAKLGTKSRAKSSTKA
jgi:prevent-host-death family protein